MRILEIRDNGGKTYDRYTIVYDAVESETTVPSKSGMRKRVTLYMARGMSENPFSPQGFGMMVTAATGAHLGKRIKFEELPEKCQKLVTQDLREDAV